MDVSTSSVSYHNLSVSANAVAQVVCCVLGMSVGDHMSDQLVRHAWMRCVLEHNACALVIGVLSWRLKTARIVRQRVEVPDTPPRLGHTLRVLAPSRHVRGK